MGFKSGFKKNQASEDDVTITDQPFADGTTMQVSYMRLRLDSWYGILGDNERVARMYAPEITPAEVARFTDAAPGQPGRYTQAATRYGVVGHSQTSARARRNGKPRIIRRDFDTVDGGLAGLHFVSIQRSIADFVATRNAMNAANASYLNPAITDTINNGINEFIFVLKRANYIIPSRHSAPTPSTPAKPPPSPNHGQRSLMKPSRSSGLRPARVVRPARSTREFVLSVAQTGAGGTRRNVPAGRRVSDSG